ncbi:MAG TPA: DUF2934 domain-containing protein [Phycisphaerae bacterium]|nr:DUF2934 domain-containing protein [Phycisphaerae bacterium]
MTPATECVRSRSKGEGASEQTVQAPSPPVLPDPTQRGEDMAVDEVLQKLRKRSDRILPPAPTTIPSVPDQETIRARAYEIYEQRVATGRFGDAGSDWQQAEAELTTDKAPISVRPDKIGRA